MKAMQLLGVFLIFIGASIAWAILGGTVSMRTQDSLSRLESQVTDLWGEPIVQQAPTLVVKETFQEKDAKGKPKTTTISHPIVPSSSDIKVDLNSQARRKGLLWYRTYEVVFDATYTAKHNYTRNPVLESQFMFPSQNATYEEFLFSVNGKEASPTGGMSGSIVQGLALAPGQAATIRIHYKTRGKDSWGYTLGEGVTQVKNFKLVANTNFQRYNFPQQSISPTTKTQMGKGWQFVWQFSSLISGFRAAVEMPSQLNPGPVIARITYFAPVGLLFFLAVVVIIGMMRRQNMHPMHYFFIAAGFFSFHLLMAYLADHVKLELTFLICAIVSVLLTVSYLIRAVGANFALRVAAPAQLLFLILFSYAFFFEGYTGLAITIASIITLAILMHVTAKVDWNERFRSAER
jgi:inner membrane protein involved in colicin E2 resistance